MTRRLRHLLLLALSALAVPFQGAHALVIHGYFGDDFSTSTITQIPIPDGYVRFRAGLILGGVEIASVPFDASGNGYLITMNSSTPGNVGSLSFLYENTMTLGTVTPSGLVETRLPFSRTVDVSWDGTLTVVTMSEVLLEFDLGLGPSGRYSVLLPGETHDCGVTGSCAGPVTLLFIPEPSTALLVAAGMLGLRARRRSA